MQMTSLQAAQFWTYFKFLVVAETHFALKSKTFSLSKFFCCCFTLCLTVLQEKESKIFYQHLLYKGVQFTRLF